MPIWVTILIAVIGSGGFFTFLQFLISRKDTEKQDVKDIKEAITEARKYDGQMLETLTAINLRLQQSEEAHISEIRTLFLLRADQIITKGYATQAEYDEIEELYREYHDVWHQNGWGTKKYQTIQNLPNHD